jgi:hypothetical protein
MILAAAGERTLVVAGVRGLWSPAQTAATTRARNVAAFVGPGGFGLYWVNAESVGLHATMAGASLAPPSSVPWAPAGPANIAWATARQVGASATTLVANRGDRLTAARLDALGGWSFVDSPEPLALARPSAAQAATGEVIVAAAGIDRVLVDLTPTATGWSVGRRHEDVRVHRDTEIETSGPAVVAQDDGDITIFYLASNTSLAAITRRGNAWSAPVTASIDSSLTFVATAARTAGAIVGVRTLSGTLLALSYSSATGFGAPIVLDEAGYGEPDALAAAPGFCGDEALFAYGSGADLRFARVNPGFASVTGVLATAGTGANVTRVALVTKEEPR